MQVRTVPTSNLVKSTVETSAKNSSRYLGYFVRKTNERKYKPKLFELGC